ncbi:MAG: class I SAM-dependent methyltransferase [Clostridia bacterium]|nr:class I SAM-dependent methyltransferase [Clostridia bacterium]
MKYERLSEIYDRFTDDFNHDDWEKWYWKLISSVKAGVKSVLDAGCGTGPLSVRFAKKGIKVTGIDLSEDMLRVASDKARKWGVPVRFVCQDMRFMEIPSRVDAVICACDGVNYLIAEDDVRMFFSRVFKALKPASPFAFDISNEEKLKKMGQTYLYGEDREDSAYIWTNDYDEKTRLIEMNLTFFVQEEDGRFARFTEAHTQKAHRVSEITALLEEAGFIDICVFGGDSGESEGPGGKRVYFLCKKP